METDSKKTEANRKEDSLRILDEVIKKEGRRRKKELVIISVAVLIVIGFFRSVSSP